MADGAGPKSPMTDISVDERGIHFSASGDQPVDVLFDDQRIGSFWTQRDTVDSGGRRTWSWPAALRPHLNGKTTVAVVAHGSQQSWGTRQVSLGTGKGPLRVQDKQGNALGLDKSNRLTKLFADRSPEHLQPLLDSVNVVLEVLAESGVRPFLAYGTLLGAVRDGALIGHDSDADLGYVSSHDHPLDAIRESYALQRAVIARGFDVNRYSGLAFKVKVAESDGNIRGLDVFGGLLLGDHLYLMGEVGAPFQDAWLHPLSTATLEGRTYPVPARPEKLLEAMYGPGWKVPDPAYQFETPRSTSRRLSGWFRGTQARKDTVWEPHYRATRPGGVQPSAFVQWVAEHHGPPVGRAVDIGCGRGDDVVFWAERGVAALGVDYARAAYARRAKRAAAKDLPALFQWASLTDLRSVVPLGIELSRHSGDTVLLARHVIEATDDFGRANFWRLARSAVAGGGTAYLQVFTGGAPRSRPHGCRRIDPDKLTAEIEATGGAVLERFDISEDSMQIRTDGPSSLSRMVVQWS